MTLEIISPQEAQNSNEQYSAVDKVVLHINATLRDPMRRNAARSAQSVGGFYQFVIRQRLTVEDVRELTRACRRAGWPGVSVAAYNDSVSVSLNPAGSLDWQSYHQGITVSVPL